MYCISALFVLSIDIINANDKANNCYCCRHASSDEENLKVFDFLLMLFLPGNKNSSDEDDEVDL